MAEPFTDLLDVPVPGGSLTVAVAGPRPGSGAPVVLAVHGITGSHRGWAAIARLLADDVTVLAPDLRGRGGSSVLPGPYAFDAHVTDLLAVLDHFGPATATVAGHSMGAYVTASLAAAAPDRVSSVVLIDGGPALPLPAGMTPDTALDALLGPAIARLSMRFASVEEYQGFWRQHPAFAARDAWIDDVLAYISYDLGETGTDGSMRSRVQEDAVRADGRALLGPEPVRAALAGVKCPATLLWAPRGLLDQPTPMLPAAAIEEAQQLVPQLEVAEVPETNHYLMVFRPREAAQAAAAIRAQL